MEQITAEEKLNMINSACKLFADAEYRIRLAKKLFRVCGIECCKGYDESISKRPYERNVQIYKGINKLEEIIGEKAHFHKDITTGELDEGISYIEHKGIVFLQLKR